MKAVAFASIGLAVLLALAGFWWWAIDGLSEPVGTATGVTSFACFAVGVVLLVFSQEDY